MKLNTLMRSAAMEKVIAHLQIEGDKYASIADTVLKCAALVGNLDVAASNDVASRASEYRELALAFSTASDILKENT